MTAATGRAHPSDAEQALLRDIRILLDQHGCELIARLDMSGAAILTGPGVRIHIDADLTRALIEITLS